MMGGTFNPPHIGHINASRAAVRELSLERLIFIPDSIPPHKEMPQFSPSAEMRFEMTRLAAIEAGAEISDIELCRGGRSYTVDTLKELKKIYPDDELWLIVGTDMFLTMEEWKTPEQLFLSVNIAVVPRADGDIAALMSHAELLGRKYGAVCRIIETGAVTISSSDIRVGIACGKLGEYVPKSVYEYIKEHGLYGVQGADAT